MIPSPNSSPQHRRSRAPCPRPIRQDLLLAVRLAWNFGYIIAIPAVLLGFGGAYVDKTWGTSPVFVLLGFALALLLSVLGIWRVVKRIMILGMK